MAWKQTAAYQQAFAKKDAIRVADALNKAGIDCEIESEVSTGKFNPRGLPKSLYVDVTIIDREFEKVGIEMDGKAHSSKEAEDMERDAWLKENASYKVILHFPNKTPIDKILAEVQSHRRKFA